MLLSNYRNINPAFQVVLTDPTEPLWLFFSLEPPPLPKLASLKPVLVWLHQVHRSDCNTATLLGNQNIILPDFTGLLLMRYFETVRELVTSCTADWKYYIVLKVLARLHGRGCKFPGAACIYREVQFSLPLKIPSLPLFSNVVLNADKADKCSVIKQ